MVGSLGLAFLALRAGLVLRRSRRRGRRAEARDRRRHVRLAKPAVLCIAIGFVGGPVSMLLWRGRDPFGTAHALLGSATLLAFLATASLGRRLERGGGSAREAHGTLGLLALLLAAGAAVAGFVLLP